MYFWCKHFNRVSRYYPHALSYIRKFLKDLTGSQQLAALVGLAAISFLLQLPVSLAATSSNFTLFESGQVRPIALSADGKKLFALNTPNNRLEVFRVTNSGLRSLYSVAVGLEPVALALRGKNEVWVVNHLSDSVSIVDVSNENQTRVTKTLLVGDEPRDIVFAGPGKQRAFITAAHRGQNLRFDPQLTTPGVGRADVWVFDADDLGNSMGGDPLTVITLFTDTPRALAVTADGTRVYAAGFYTGNATTIINELFVTDALLDQTMIYPESSPASTGFGPDALVNHAGIKQPRAGLIVKSQNGHWVDDLGQNWDALVPFSLPDRDVFTIDATANPPSEIKGGAYSGVGTVLFNMAVNPVNGHVYVSNTEAQNQSRFEGAGTYAGHSVRGHLHESRITVLGRQSATSVETRHLNKHIDYNRCCAPIPNAENDASVAFPLDMTITPDGKQLYVAGFGSSEVAVYDTEALETNSFTPDARKQIHVDGGGPSGLALDSKRNRIYALTRFDNGISIVDTKTTQQTGHVKMYNPEPDYIVKGRRFLYDASLTSSHGDSACASCHVFGDMDHLAWDLGDPDGDQTENTGPFKLTVEQASILFDPALLTDDRLNPNFRPMKGPMITQSLRGMDNHGPMHWRGDRTGGNRAILDEDAGPSLQPNGGAFNEDLAFRKFNIAFPGLIGRDSTLSPEDMQSFTNFILDLMYPPNPIRNLDNSLNAPQKRGRDFFTAVAASDTFQPCNGCHILDVNGNKDFPGVKHPGFFGTDGQYSFESEPQFLKIPHLRNLYQKVGMFGMTDLAPNHEFFKNPSAFFANLLNTGNQGEQISGFGFAHDGSVDTIFRFVSASTFFQRPPGEAPNPDPGNLGGLPNPFDPSSDQITQRRDLEAFMLAFDSNLAPIVGQQVTLNASNAERVGPRIDLLISRATALECDLIAHSANRAYVFENGTFSSVFRRKAALTDTALRNLAKKRRGEITYTCVPPGNGARIALGQ